MTEAEPRLVDTGRGYTITYRGKTLYSPKNPRAAAVRRATNPAIEPRTLVFVPSLGLGYGLTELLARLPDSCHVLCIEVDERLFKLALTDGPPLPRSPDLTIIRAQQPKQAAGVVQSLGPWRFRRVLPLHLCGGYQLYRREYRELLEAAEDEIRLFWQNKLTLVAMAELWLKNLFTNLRSLPDAGDIADLATTGPVLICGAGPSLEGSLEWIGSIRNKVILMAVDTALPVLAAADLPPDWVITLDAQIHTLLDFLPYRDPRIKILCDLTSNPRCLRLFPDLFFFSTRFQPLRLFERLEAAALLPTPLPPRGSVGVCAVEAALEITTGPVLFTGLDFSYPSGQTHSRGTPVQLSMLQRSTRFQPCGMVGFQTLLSRPRLHLQSKEGQQLLTDLVLQSYALQLQSINTDCPRSYDLGAKGLPLGACRIGSLQQLVDLCGETAADVKRKTKTAGKPGNRRRPSLQGVHEFCEREQRLLSAVSRTIAGSDHGLPGVISPVEYLLLSLPEANPDRLFTPSNIARIDAQAKMLALRLRRTQAEMPESNRRRE